MPVIYKTQILQKLVNTIGNKKQFKAAAYAEALVRTTDAKRKLMQDFENHKVTQELRAGAKDPLGAPNVSGTLNIAPRSDGTTGNLFSFIGFDSGEDPAEKVKEELDKIILRKTPISSIRQRNGLSWIFRVDVPGLRDLYQKFRYPDGWSSGSWLQGIERGISGLSYYLRGGNFYNSRSGGAIQSKRGPVRSAEYTPIQYMTELLGNFSKYIKRKR